MNSLLRWEESWQAGQELTTDDLCKSHPHLLFELQRRIEILRGSIWLAEPHAPWDDVPPGSVLANRYRIEELIAEGGFSNVWKAFDSHLQRPVALKFSQRHSTVGGDRIKREAYRTARLKHCRIVVVHDLIRSESASCLVMEFMSGGTLADRQKEAPLGLAIVSRYGQQIAQALDHAHRNGVVHCDVKPENILFDHDDAKLADFGVATSPEVTDDRSSMVTRRYAAPEQLAGEAALPQSDIYSLALLLVESLSGRLPDWNEAVGRDILIDLNEDAAATLRRALHPDPTQRCRSVLELWEAAVRWVS